MLCRIFHCKDSSIKYQFPRPLFGGLTKITKARYKHEVCLVATGKNEQRNETKVCVHPKDHLGKTLFKFCNST